MTITVRPATAADVPALLSLYADMHRNDPPVPSDVADAVWQHIAAQEGRVILVAECDGVVVGTVDCAVLPNLTRAARAFMLVENVVTASHMRRRGVGAALFDSVAELAKKTNCYKIQLLTGSSSDGVHTFYAAQGFTPSAKGFRLYL